MLKPFAEATRPKNGTDFVKLHLFADVKEKQADRRAAQGWIGMRIHGELVYRETGVSAYSVVLLCDLCGQELLTAERAEKTRPDAFVPTVTHRFRIPSCNYKSTS